MLTIEALRDWGADVEDGLRRCMNKESFYLGLIGKAVDEAQLTQLKDAVAAGELAKAFELAHALKGVYTNLSLTPLAEPIIEITELLRSRTQTDYVPLLTRTEEQLRALQKLIG